MEKAGAHSEHSDVANEFVCMLLNPVAAVWVGHIHHSVLSRLQFVLHGVSYASGSRGHGRLAILPCEEEGG